MLSVGGRTSNINKKRKRLRKMPRRCVVFGCGSVANQKDGISVHLIPFFDDNRPEAVRRRKLWVNFVKRTRKNWEVTKHACICSKHFNPEDYEQCLVSTSSLPEFSGKFLKSLRYDDIGIVPYPSIYPEKKAVVGPSSQPSTSRSSSCRSRRQVVRNALRDLETDVAPPLDEVTNRDSDADEPTGQFEVQTEKEASQCDNKARDCSVQTQGCVGCQYLSTQYTRMRNLWKGAKHKLEMQKKENKSLQRQIDKVVPIEAVASSNRKDEIEKVDVEENEDADEDHDDDINESMTYDEEFEVDEDCQMEEDEMEDVVLSEECGVREESKFIVFLSQLLLLFQICRSCKSDGLLTSTRKVGTMVVVSTLCSNPNCKEKEMVWKSQPNFPSTKIPAGNLLLCFGTLIAGASATKVFNIFRHMGLSCVSLATYYKHQKEKLFPAVYLYWKDYQQRMNSELRNLDQKLILAGDARHDSVGHSAKYGVYSIFCCNKPLITHFELVQRNEVGSSQGMEYEGFKRCFSHLLSLPTEICTFVSDRHSSIIRHMREDLPAIIHYFDLWHLKKKIRKLLSKISKEKGCELLAEWINACVNHLHWSAASTPSGNGDVIAAKFNSFLGHITNIHEGHPDPIFNRCAHGENFNTRVKWIKKDSELYEKVSSALSNKNLQRGIRQASPLSQTSCLESFHSVVNHFCPKMIAFSYVGMYCRHALAAVHFNNNLHRETKKNADGSSRVAVHYPKFKNGEATIKDIRVKPNFGYVSEIFEKLVIGVKEGDLSVVGEELKKLVPPPMHSAFEKESRQLAVHKHRMRKKMVTVEIPPTRQAEKITIKKKMAPHCRSCHKPMKGHKSADCQKK